MCHPRRGPRFSPFPSILFWLICWHAPLAALEVQGTTYLELREVAGQLGMKTRWIERGKSMALESQWTRMVFEVHKREVELNGLRVHLGYPVAEASGVLFLSESDYRHHLQPILTPQVFGKPPRIGHILLDPGHGGSDPGARNTELQLVEKHLTLDLAKRLKNRLQAAGYRVSLTREGDQTVALAERSRLATSLEADLFISLHFNSLDKATVAGVETFAFTPPYQPSTARTALHSSDQQSYPGNAHDPWNALIGYYFQRSMQDRLQAPDRGLKRARFAVLRDLTMPGVLIEGGFLSHPREGRNIGSAAYRDRLADSLLEGLQAYQRTVDRLSPATP